MTSRIKPFGRVLYYQKFLGLFLIIIGIPVMLLDKTEGAEIPLLVGLFTFFIATEKVEDERSTQIKTSSLYIAFILGYAVKLITSNLYSHNIITVHLTEINHFIIMVFALAILLYYSRLYVIKA